MGLFTTVFPFGKSASADFFISYLCTDENDGYIATLAPVLYTRNVRTAAVFVVGLLTDQDQ